MTQRDKFDIDHLTGVEVRTASRWIGCNFLAAVGDSAHPDNIAAMAALGALADRRAGRPGGEARFNELMAMPVLEMFEHVPDLDVEDEEDPTDPTQPPSSPSSDASGE